MTLQSVPALSLVANGILLLIALIIPAGLFLFIRKRVEGKKLPFFVGCGTFLLFALVLEGLCHTIILGGGRAEALMAKPLLYGLYGGFMAGLFEETGRFLAFKTILKKAKDDDGTALMYGAGHGGFEAFYLLVVSAVTNLVLPSQTANPFYPLLGIIERIPAIAIHISLSVLVWFAAKKKDKLYLYPLAIVLHLLVDAVAAVLALKKVNVVLIEFLVYVFAAAFVCIAILIWKKLSDKKKCLSV